MQTRVDPSPQFHLAGWRHHVSPIAITPLLALQANAKQWESLEPAVKLWTERENSEAAGAVSKARTQNSKTSSPDTTDAASAIPAEQEKDTSAISTPAERTGGDITGASETTSQIYDEAASLLAHNRAVLGQALARSGHADRGIEELEAACPEILEYQQNAQGRRDSKSES